MAAASASKNRLVSVIESLLADRLDRDRDLALFQLDRLAIGIWFQLFQAGPARVLVAPRSS
jgi:hypothetical protein